MSSSPFQTRRRVYIACLNCRKRKIKCMSDDSEMNPCTRCIRKGLVCRYVSVGEVTEQRTRAERFGSTPGVPTLAPQPGLHPTSPYGRQAPVYPTNPQPQQHIPIAPLSGSPTSDFARDNGFQPDPTQRRYRGMTPAADLHHAPSSGYRYNNHTGSTSHGTRQSSHSMRPSLPMGYSTSFGYSDPSQGRVDPAFYMPQRIQVSVPGNEFKGQGQYVGPGGCFCPLQGPCYCGLRRP
ncbi:hypothetical protein DFH07DRAFT_991761 [Mycena maculata]|uniref:Zn(2)-C6 fungal-type domain-containing protein n=1 Tax=Mycena maculata TaxID=230809 RepID=A0AAD7HZJ7_9AGAR|nr:hypothetical protein DFH07DRAFT_991761 [Mycena maculata]